MAHKKDSTQKEQHKKRTALNKDSTKKGQHKRKGWHVQKPVARKRWHKQARKQKKSKTRVAASSWLLLMSDIIT